MSIRAGETYDMKLPDLVKKAVLAVGGRTVYGDPLYRLVWGWQRLELRIGVHTDHDDSGNAIRRELRAEWWPRYSPRDRWHLETWKPPEFYGSPDKWEDDTYAWIGGERVPQLGPYPSQGEYEHVAVCQSEDGEFMLPTEAAVTDLILWHRRALALTKTERKALAAARDAEEREVRRNRYRDIIDSEAKAFPFRTWVPVSGKNPRPNPSA